MQEENSTPSPAMQDRKARFRTEPSPTLQRMVESAILDAKHRILCFGCGRGADVHWLQMRKFDVQGYDPYPPFGYSQLPTGKFDFVFLIYLMTRLKTDENRRNTLAKAAEFVRPGGQLVVLSRNWAHLAREAGKEGRAGAAEHIASLWPEAAFEAWEMPELTTDDHAVCVTARRAGIYVPANPVTWVDDPAALPALCERLGREPVVGLDVETTLEEPRTLCTIQLGVPGQTWVVDALAMENLAPLKTVMENPAVEKVIHNALFEEQMLAKHGIRIINVFDTLPSSRKKYKKGVEGGHKLGDVCERELGIYLDKTLQTSDWTQRPLTPEQLRYAAVDAEVLLDLHRVFNPPKAPENLELFPD